MSETTKNKATPKSFLKKWPFYVLLLPVFFVIHGVRENFGFILIADYLPLVLFYTVLAIIIYLLFYLLYRKPIKAGIITFIILGFFFFYGFLQDFLKLHFPAINRYTILLPLFLILLIILIILLKKSRSSFIKLNLFLNCLLLIYTVYDLSGIIIKTINPPTDKFSIHALSRDENYSICKDCKKPDIYFLLFDEYASSLCLKNDFGYDNNQLDTFLTNKQFRIQKASSGNYNFTPFSISSILNMSYINGINAEYITSDDYARCNKLIRENELTNYLSLSGYDIVNYSIFDITGNPSPLNQDFLPLKAKLITDRTLWGRIKKDILWNIFYGKFEIKWFSENGEYVYDRNNKKIIDLVKEESSRKSNSPRFIYAHYSMPHPPYYYDQNGKAVEKAKLGHAYDNDKTLYLGYVGYTNIKIQEIVNTILKNSNGEAVILVMGDHGYRNDKSMPQHVFLQNQNAVYLPDKNYTAFYDSITGVNQFRVVINTLFNQKIPLLKDSTVFLKDAY
jgi:hypothetical protein